MESAVASEHVATARDVAAVRVRRATAAVVAAAAVTVAALAATGRTAVFLPVALVLGWTQLAGL
jgi:hypothetical protein